MSDIEGLGATGKFPEGKLSEDDEGELRIAIGSLKGKVIADFGPKPIACIGMLPEQAEALAESLLRNAAKARNESSARREQRAGDKQPAP